LSSLYKKLAGQTFIYGFGTIFTRILNYIILTPYLTRELEITEYGVFTDLYAYAGVVLVLLLYGLETGFFRFANKSYYKKNEVFSNALLSVVFTSVFFLVVIQIFIAPISDFLKYPNNSIYIQLFSYFLAFDAISAILMAKLRNDEKPIKFSIINITNVVVSVLLILFFFEVVPRVEGFERLHAISDKHGLVVYVFIANFFASAVKLVLLLSELKGIKLSLNISLLRSLLIYSLPLLVSGLGGIINEMFDRIIYKFVEPSKTIFLTEIGIYGAVYKLAVLITLFIQMFRYAAEPFFFNLQNTKDSKEIYGNVLNYFLIFTLAIFLFIIFYLDILKYFIDIKYHVGLHVVPIILASNVLLGLLFNINFWFKISGQTKYAIIIMITGAVITILINVLFIPKFRYVACAWAHLLSNASMLLLSYFLGQRHYAIKYNLKRIFFYIVLAAGLFVVQNVLKTYDKYNLFIGTILLILFVAIAIRKENLLNVLFHGNKSSK
jgi:O-antigen/teichoic acid export membrane protein